MGRLLKLILSSLPLYFDELFNNDAHSIISKKGSKILLNQKRGRG